MKKKLGLMVLVLGILSTYYIVVRYTDFGIPCLFYTVFHLKCPGCGITHMLTALVEGRWKDAFDSNPYLFISLPYLIYLCVFQLCNWLTEKNRKIGKFQNNILLVYLFGLIVFGIIRNII
ncbi:MAG: DUF2752 domain-containing protein [Lachnospiraceae bacterium]|nr:DUF2752 domain-containing protein [Lachnospiraceae bacterium]